MCRSVVIEKRTEISRLRGILKHAHTHIMFIKLAEIFQIPHFIEKNYDLLDFSRGS